MINPVEVDTLLAKLYGDAQKAQSMLDRAQVQAHQAVGDRRRTRTSWGLTEDEVFARLEEMAELPDYRADYAKSALQALTTAVEAIESVRAEQAPLDELYRESRWTRAFLCVTQGQGHVHRSMNCNTCYLTTQFSWLPELSGHDQAEIVELAGERACTVCYPDAPIETRSRPTQLFTQDEVARKEAHVAKLAAKASRDAKKAAASITSPDGSPLEIQGTFRREVVETLRTARIELTDEFWYATWSTRTVNQENVRVLSEAIAAKEAKTVEQVIAEAQKWAEKRK